MRFASLPCVLCFISLFLCPTGVVRAESPIEIEPGQRIAFVGNSTAERMNLFGHFETRLQHRFFHLSPHVRNFAWPGDEVSVRQRPGNYDKIDDPFLVDAPNLLICFFGFNESFRGDSPETLKQFKVDYGNYVAEQTKRLSELGTKPRFVIVSPLAFESTGNPLQPDGELENRRLQAYANAAEEFAHENDFPFADLFTPTLKRFSEQPGAQYTINGIHLNEAGDSLMAELLDKALFGDAKAQDPDSYEALREVVVDKSWLHQQDYRMLNGWYVYGGRRTWDTETFPNEFQKIRKMV
ncbi:MAG: SGNH/GDSL hydrolase family protein, partial [Planctomycetota bacterium]